MTDIFQYDFMIRALIAGVAIGIAAPLIGSFLVAKRYSLIADSLAHVSLAGITLAVIIGIEPLIGALAAALIAALIIEKLRRDQHVTSDVALAIFLSSGLALAIVLVGFANNVSIDLMSYLFGSITTVTTRDLYIIVPLTVIIVGVVIARYRALTYTVFSEEQAQASGIATKRLNQLLIILAAITVVASLRIVGGLLIGALTVIPVAAAAQIARSHRQTVIFSVAIGLLSVLVGLFVSYYLNIAAGGAIVLTALTTFILAVIVSRLAK